MKIFKYIPLFVVSLISFDLLGQPPIKQLPNVIKKYEIELTRPWRSGLLKVETQYSRISVEAHDIDYIDIEIHDLQGQNAEYNSLDPNRWDDVEAPFTFVENENDVIIEELAESETGLLILIKVPEKFSVKLRSELEDVFVFDLRGQIEANTKAGNIVLTRIYGSAVANSESGNIDAYYKEVTPRYPHALSTLRGDLKLVLPTNSSTNVFIGCNNGKVKSEYPTRTSGKSDQNERIKIIKTGMGEASIGLRTYYGNVSIYKS